MQPRKTGIQVDRIYQKSERTIDLTEQEADFCRLHHYWPGKWELVIKQPTEADRKTAKEIAKKCNCTLKFIT